MIHRSTMLTYRSGPRLFTCMTFYLFDHMKLWNYCYHHTYHHVYINITTWSFWWSIPSVDQWIYSLCWCQHLTALKVSCRLQYRIQINEREDVHKCMADPYCIMVFHIHCAHGPCFMATITSKVIFAGFEHCKELHVTSVRGFGDDEIQNSIEKDS